MKKALAGGIHYFEPAGFPLAVRRVRTGPENRPSHPHDLTEVRHSHDFCELVIVTRGSALHWLEESEFPVTAGDVFLLQGRQSHYFHDRKNLELINIMYDPAQIGLPEAELRKLPGYCAMFMLEPSYRRRHRFASRLHLQRIPLARAEQLADEMEKECAEKSAGYEAALRAKLIELMVYLARAYNFSEAVEARALLRVGHVIGALENDFARNWQLRELQQTAGMSRSNLLRVFHKATGQTPIDYLIQLRIQRAGTLLKNPALSITDIAMQTGFNDSNYFSRQFKKFTGTSPSAHRRQF